ncbi:hypothetical protein ACLB2K_031824 [Fragaria x ananassa]
MFADDCLIFGKASPKAARNILTVLNNFSAASGQKINFDKSSLYFSPKVSNVTKVNIVSILAIQQKATIGKYLGVHNVIFWKDPSNAKDLMLRISKKNHNSGLVGFSTQNPLAIIKWHPPPPNFCKLNFDGSVNHMDSAATGFIIIDDNGQFVAAGVKRVGSSSVPTVEVAPLREGLLKSKREAHQEGGDREREGGREEGGGRREEGGGGDGIGREEGGDRPESTRERREETGREEGGGRRPGGRREEGGDREREKIEIIRREEGGG